MRNVRFAVTLAVTAVTAGGLLWAQGMQNKMDMNDMPYAQVKAMMSNPEQATKAMQMAKMNHVMLMAGMPVKGRSVTLKGELTDANCYVSDGLHGHNHAMCAKACVAAGSPMVFLADSGKVYTILTAKDGMALPEDALNDLGKPGVTVHGTVVKSHGVDALALESVE